MKKKGMEGENCMTHKPHWVTEEEFVEGTCIHISGGLDQKGIEHIMIISVFRLIFLSDLTLTSN